MLRRQSTSSSPVVEYFPIELLQRRSTLLSLHIVPAEGVHLVCCPSRRLIVAISLSSHRMHIVCVVFLDFFFACKTIGISLYNTCICVVQYTSNLRFAFFLLCKSVYLCCAVCMCTLSVDTNIGRVRAMCSCMYTYCTSISYVQLNIFCHNFFCVQNYVYLHVLYRSCVYNNVQSLQLTEC